MSKASPLRYSFLSGGTIWIAEAFLLEVEGAPEVEEVEEEVEPREAFKEQDVIKSKPEKRSPAKAVRFLLLIGSLRLGKGGSILWVIKAKSKYFTYRSNRISPFSRRKQEKAKGKGRGLFLGRKKKQLGSAFLFLGKKEKESFCYVIIT